MQALRQTGLDARSTGVGGAALRASNANARARAPAEPAS
jgi:hypothetical protein